MLIQDAGRRTACISTQVGCGMGCVFCASGLNGVDRNLTAGEILEQLVRLRNLPGPLHRERDGALDATSSSWAWASRWRTWTTCCDALDVATSKDGLGIGARHITISTVGLPAKIRRLADLGKQYHLAVSLHAPNDALRTRIVPTNDKTGWRDPRGGGLFLRADRPAGDYEYVLLRGINDDVVQARELARLLRGRCAHVNVIPFNDVEGLPYRRPTHGSADGVQPVLRHSGISVKVRKRKGWQIDAACGQLRRSHVDTSTPLGKE